MKFYGILLIAICSFIAGSLLFPLHLTQIPKIVSADVEVNYSQEEEQTINVYKNTNEAVVFISTVNVSVDPFDWFPEVRPQKGSGSGIIVSAKQGIIITNLHVISNAQKIEIFLADGQKYNANLLGFDEEYDLAVLKLLNPPANLTELNFGNSNILQVGQRVLAIGNPFGLNRTLTTGIISSLDRTLNTGRGSILKGMIQTDAAINPGNSGGALLDSAGNLIGINTVILSNSGDSAGIGFAIPVNKIKKILPELIATGKVLRPNLGWVLVDTSQGVLVRRVIKDSPAAKADIQPLERYVSRGLLSGFIRDYEHADIVSEVNGNKVSSRLEIEDFIENLKSGDSITVTLKQGGINGEERKVKLKPIWE